MVGGTKGNTENARRLRANMTDTERRFWLAVRGRRAFQLKIRRQVPIGAYVADFACFEPKFVVELDGSQHAESQRDKARDAYLEGQGFRVFRFWNTEINENLDGVLETIARELGVH